MNTRSKNTATVDAEALTPRKPTEILREEYLERKQVNPTYSLTAFARDLGISQPFLSLIFSGKRPLTLKQATQIALLLGYSREKAEQFVECALLALPATSKALKKIRKIHFGNAAGGQAMRIPLFSELDLERFRIISRWYHLPILDLSTTRGFKSDPVWIARKLGITPLEAKDAMERLLQLGLATREKGVFIKSQSKIQFPSGKSESFVRSFHQQMIGKSIEELQRTSQVDYDAREISSMTMAIPRTRVEAARKMIRKFQQDLAAFMTEGDCDEVYQMNVQMFPLTRSDS